MVRIDSGKEYSKLKLDVKDKKILDILSEDSRIPISQLAKKIEISRDVTNYKINRLVELGVIEKFIPKIDYRKLNFNTYHLFMMLDGSKNTQKLFSYLELLKGVHFIFEYSDKWDLEVIIIAKNMRELDKLISKLQADFSDIIMERIVISEINTYQSIIFSYYFNKDLKSLNHLYEKNNISDKVCKYDNIDLEILKKLSLNARKSTYDLAREISLSADAIGLRIKKLKREGIIKKFTILPNFSKLNYSWYTLCIKMKFFDKRYEKKFREFIEHHPKIIRVAKTFGEWDVLMYVIAQNSSEFHQIIKEIKKYFPEIIKNYITFNAYKEHYYAPFPSIIFEDKVQSNI